MQHHHALWKYVSETEDCVGKYKFDLLLKVPKLVLALPHLNSSEENVFDMVKTNKISFRASISFNTLRSVLSVKLTKPNATKFKPGKALLKSAKSETWEYNKTLVFLIIQYHKKVKKGDVIILLLAVYFYLHIFCCNNDEGNDTKQISLFFIIPGG